MAFKPRRTPAPSIAGINLNPRPNPNAPVGIPQKLGGQGHEEGWVSPHHKDYYGRVDESTMKLPHLLHGDPQMPISRLARGDGVVALDPMGGPAVELTDYRHGGVAASSSPSVGDDLDHLEYNLGLDAADAIRTHLRQFHKRLEVSEESGEYSPLDEIEETFRTIDRFTAAPGSTQERALMRRAKSEAREYEDIGKNVTSLSSPGRGGDSGESAQQELGHGRGYAPESVFGKGSKIDFPYSGQLPSPTYHPDFPKGSNVGDMPADPEEEAWVTELNKLMYEEQYTEFELGDIDTVTPVSQTARELVEEANQKQERNRKWNINDRPDHEKEREEKPDEILEMIKNGEDPNQEAFGPWSECTVKVDRVQKVERGGTTVRYRALVIGGNGNGAAGFGIGKALSPNEAIIKAGKHCKRNVFYVDRYLNSGVTYDLAGRHNSCKVQIRAVTPDYGLHGHPLICEILKFSGISDASTKSHGNRNPYNVVYATFKALMTQESLEEVALKRGKKLINMQRARRLGI